ncbi:hypothetical protein JXJ21_15725 [candidate division KSB1 bacterium]|nr:hypothetical protein [candidate division KSB1 bacterium]
MIQEKSAKLNKSIIQAIFIVIVLILSSQITFAAIDYSIKGGPIITNEDGIGTFNWVPIIDITLIPIEPEWIWDIRFEFGFNNFEYENLDKSFHWMNFSASVRYFILRDNLKTFIGFGPGLYVPEEGDNRFGLKFALGVDIPINDRFTFEVGTDVHNIFLEDDNFTFFPVTAGILYRF